jgi:hypothetical protein
MAEERLTSRPVASLRALPHRQDTVAQVCRVRHAHVAEPRILRPMPRTEESTAALPGVTHCCPEWIGLDRVHGSDSNGFCDDLSESKLVGA